MSAVTPPRFTLSVPTEGQDQIIDLTREVDRHLREIGGDGIVHLFVVGSTAALTTLEYEPGLVKHDFAAMFERIAPSDGVYDHEATWNDDNGHSHLRAALLGPAISIPIATGKMLLGQYQQLVLCEFDTRSRKRQVIATVLR